MRLVDPPRFSRALPLLVGELAIGAAALSAVSLTVDEPAYEGFVMLALVAGLLVSAWGLARGHSPVWPGAVVMLFTFVFYLGRSQLTHVFPLFFPPEVATHEDIVLAALVGWLLVVFSCWQANRANLVFLIVCGLAVFGLMGTVNLNAEILVAFAFFMCASVFCWGYEQFLTMDERLVASGQRRVSDWLAMARGHLSVALLVGLLTFSLGGLIGTGAYHVSPNIYARMAKRVYGWDVTRGGKQTAYNNFDSSFQIGTGSIRLSPLPVMEVEADRAALWRGMAYDYYTGHGWGRTLEGGHLLSGGPTEFSVPQQWSPPEDRSHLSWQRFRLLNLPGRIFAANQPVLVSVQQTQAPREPRWGGPRLMAEPWMDAYGCLTWRAGDLRGEYAVASREPFGDADGLASAAGGYEATYFEPYLQVTPQVRLELEPLVKQLTAASDTNYAKVAVLKRYVEEHCLYSLTGAAAPRDQDSVVWFLSDARRGACDMFSSSLAVLCRLAGVPARVVTGFATGEYDHERGVYVVKGTDAHAWVEVFFRGYGWVTFDPQAADSYAEQSLTDLLTGGYWKLAVRETARQILLYAFAALVLVLAVAAVVDPLAVLRRLSPSSPRSQLGRLSAEYRALYALLARRCGLKISAAQTPQETMAAIGAASARRLPLSPEELLTLNARFYRVRYAREVPFTEVAALRAELRDLRRKLRRRP